MMRFFAAVYVYFRMKALFPTRSKKNHDMAQIHPKQIITYLSWLVLIDTWVEIAFSLSKMWDLGVPKTFSCKVCMYSQRSAAQKCSFCPRKQKFVSGFRGHIFSGARGICFQRTKPTIAAATPPARPSKWSCSGALSTCRHTCTHRIACRCIHVHKLRTQYLHAVQNWPQSIGAHPLRLPPAKPISNEAAVLYMLEEPQPWWIPKSTVACYSSPLSD